MFQSNPINRVLCVALAITVILTSLSFAPVLATNPSDFVVKDGHVLMKYTGNDAVVVIPDSLAIVEIANGAFSSNQTLTSVTVPNGVLAIGRYAFAFCDNLAAVTLPATLTYIGDHCFGGCPSLKSISLPASLKNAGYGPFRDTGITVPLLIDSGKTLIYVPTDTINYTIPSTVAKINGRAFFNCTMLLAVTIPQSVTSIEQDAFCFCIKLTAVILPTNISTFGCSPFRGTGITKPILYDSGKKLIYVPGNYTSYTIPATVTSINAGALTQCTEIKSISIPATVQSIGDFAFYYSTSLASISFASQNIPVGESAFTGTVVPNTILMDAGKTLCYVPAKTKQFTFPASVTKINAGAFADCLYITDIVIPKAVTFLGNKAFDGCGALKTLVASSKLTNIGSNPFTGMKTLTVYGEVGSEIQKSAKLYELIFVVIPAIKAVTSAGILKSYAYTNKSVTILPYGYDYKLSATKNGAKFTFPATKVFKYAGKYVVTMKTAAKTKTFTFTIDKSKPNIMVKNAKGIVVKANVTIKGSATFAVTDANLSAKSITLNGKAIPWPTSKKVTKKGAYLLTAKDKAGNKATFGFKIVL